MCGYGLDRALSEEGLVAGTCECGNTWKDNKVRELASVCLSWQHWTKVLVRFDDIDKSAFHNCVVVDLSQSLSEWHLLLPACVWCAAMRMSKLELQQRTNIKFLVVS